MSRAQHQHKPSTETRTIQTQKPLLAQPPYHRQQRDGVQKHVPNMEPMEAPAFALTMEANGFEPPDTSRAPPPPKPPPPPLPPPPPVLVGTRDTPENRPRFASCSFFGAGRRRRATKRLRVRSSLGSAAAKPDRPSSPPSSSSTGMASTLGLYNRPPRRLRDMVPSPRSTSSAVHSDSHTVGATRPNETCL